jgi:glycosyltransferase involved in cell wall biosynthesis
MKNIVLIYSLLLGCTIAATQSNCEFAVIIPSYNNQAYFKENLDSICFQESTNPYHIYYVNDCSTDKTNDLVEDYIKQHQLEDKVTLINNPINLGGGANIYNTVHNYIKDHEIVVILDGDDTLVDNTVLLTLEKHYEDPNTWLTYGRYRKVPSGKEFGNAIHKNVYRDKKIRERGHINALRTFKAALYKKIKREDFLHEGEFKKTTWDTAFILPMLEMCSPKNENGINHAVFIPQVMYLYRCDNPLNDFRINRNKQMDLAWFFRTKEPYQPLDSLD